MRYCFILLIVFVQTVIVAQTHRTIDGLVKKKGALELLVVGDWGRNGEYFQKPVASVMADAAHALGTKYILSTGDNFYPEGVISTQDPLWRSSFEEVYTSHLLQVRWFPVLGNHDYAGDPQAEVAYSKISRRWNMPDRYYTQTKYAADGTKVLLLFIDTSPFEKGYHASKDEPFGSNIRAQDTAEQRKWLDSTLRFSDAKWKIVVGHHPLHTSGPRKGRDNDVAVALLPTLLTKSDMYIAGHEHILEHDILPGGLQHFISGAGSQVTESTGSPITKFVASQAGFMTCSITATECLVQFVNHEGKLIYSTVVKK